MKPITLQLTDEEMAVLIALRAEDPSRGRWYPLGDSRAAGTEEVPIEIVAHQLLIASDYFDAKAIEMMADEDEEE